MSAVNALRFKVYDVIEGEPNNPNDAEKEALAKVSELMRFSHSYHDRLEAGQIEYVVEELNKLDDVLNVRYESKEDYTLINIGLYGQPPFRFIHIYFEVEVGIMTHFLSEGFIR